MVDLKVVMVTCHGAANTGQLAGMIATELVRENEDYHMVCLPAVAIGKDTSLEKIARAGTFVIIEGCPMMCCSRIVAKHLGREPDIRLEMVADYGVKKDPTLDFDKGEKEKIKADINLRIEEVLAQTKKGKEGRDH